MTDTDLEAIDSGDAAFLGMIVGGVAGYKLSGDNWLGGVLGAGAGVVASGESFDRVLGEPDSLRMLIEGEP